MAPDSKDKTTSTLGSGDVTVYAGRTEATRAESPASPPTLRFPAKDANRLPVGTRLSEFEITGVIGEGGFGIVYTAHDHSLDRDVAIKEYMPSSLAMRVDDLTVVPRGGEAAETFENGLRSFVNEAKLLARFDHSSLLKVYRFWESNGTAYMAMPHYKGVTLKQRLKQSGVPAEDWLRAMLMQLLAALDVIHRENIFHRDIAPDNILLVAEDRPVLLDFGAARRVIGDMTHALTVILKPGFAPVEQYADVPKLKQGPWTDLYALAAVIYYAIIGEKPQPSIGRYVSDAQTPLIEAVRGRYSETFLTAIDTALRVHPDDRPQNAEEFRALLAGQAPRPATGQTLSAASAAATAMRTAAIESPAPMTDAAPSSAPSPVPSPDATVSRSAVTAETPPVSVPAVPPTAPVSQPPPPAVAVTATIRADAPRAQAAGAAATATVRVAEAAPPSAASAPRSGSTAWIAGLAVALLLIAGGGYYATRFFGGAAPSAERPASQPAQSAATPTAVSPAPGETAATSPVTTQASAATPQGDSARPSTMPVDHLPAGAAQPGKAPATTTALANAGSAATPVTRAAIKPASQPGSSDKLRQLLAAANASFESKDFDKAQSLAAEALKIEPGNRAALAIRDKAQKAAWSEVQIQ